MNPPLPSPAPPEKRLGRPSKFSGDIVAVICRNIAGGLPLEYAAALAGISHETFHAWRRKYPAFRADVERAIAQGTEERLKTIREAAKTDWRASAWWLEHILPEKFARNRLELTGADGTPLAGSNVLIYLPQKERVADMENVTPVASQAIKGKD